MYQSQSRLHLADCLSKGIPAESCSLIDKLVNDFKGVNWFWIVVICGIFMLSNIFRALRWHQLMEPLGFAPRIMNSLGAVVLAYFANLGIPRIGELVRAATISRYEKIPIEKAMGTIVLGRLLDFICLFVVMLLAFIISFDHFVRYFQDNFIYDPWMVLVVVITILLLGFTSLIIFNRLLENSTSNNKLIIKIQKLWVGFKDGLVTIKRVRNIPLLVFYSASIWIMYFLMIYLCFNAYQPTEHLGAEAGLVAFVFGSLGIVFPAPGGMGSYQFMVSQALVIYAINSVDAFTFSNIVFFAIQIFGNVIFGVLFLILLPIYNRK